MKGREKFIEELDFTPVIIIVDDYIENLRVLINTISKKIENCDIIPFDNGLDALEYIKKEPPHLIILDINMSNSENPEYDGFKIAEEIKLFKDACNIPIIFLTAKSDSESIINAFELGGVDYVTKPIIEEVFFQRVLNHLELYIKTVELKLLANTDSLTNIYNRRIFDIMLDNALKRCLRNKTPLSLLMIDIDKFKNYNDTYGHLKGDDVIRKIADILTISLRREADIVARYGGEEFAIILEDTDKDGFLKVTRNIQENLERENIEHKNSVVSNIVTLSIGVASIIPNPDLTAKKIIDIADKNLYKAKENGRNKVEY